MFCLRTFCPYGSFVATDVLSPRMFCPTYVMSQDVLSPRMFRLSDVLYLRMFRPAGHFVPLDILSLRPFCPSMLCLRTLCLRTLCLRTLSLQTFCLGTNKYFPPCIKNLNRHCLDFFNTRASYMSQLLSQDT